MASKVSEGMTKAEVIAAIGQPDDDDETRVPGAFGLFYKDGVKVLIVKFRQSKVYGIDNVDPYASNVPAP